MSDIRVGVIGATGAVGREMLSLIQERRFPAREVRVFASERSAGTTIPFAGGDLIVEVPSEEVFGDLDLALFSAGGRVSRAFARAASRAGCMVVDNSSAFRMEDDVPLVVPEINAAALDGHRNLVANPNCTTIVNALAVAPLHDAFRLRRMVVASYQAASGAGAAGLAELMGGTRGHLEGDESPPEVFAAPLPFNVVPQIGAVGEDGGTDEEAKMGTETRKILGVPDLEVVCTCVRVPVARAHGVASTLWFERPVDMKRARAALDQASGIRWHDLPTPRAASARDEVLVGRLRAVPFDERALTLFAVGDQVRKGAALNALQIAERLIADR
ncbi:MAG: aspartate-semialdehyde dehydrogenase [Planctomycetota bacterium]|nr:aspartate-semialdehyde dehydrogenase [Planctomycetota bacterium]